MLAARLRSAREGLPALRGRVSTWLRQPGLAAALAPLVLAVVLAPWLWICCGNYAHGVLFRDSTMFLYVAWCVRHGERLYDTVAMPDGPLVCFLHIVMQVLGGPSERGFRLVDFWMHAILSGVAGALLVPPSATRPAIIATTDSWCAGKDCVKEFGTLCPDFPRMVGQEYGPVKNIEGNNVFLLKAEP